MELAAVTLRYHTKQANRPMMIIAIVGLVSFAVFLECVRRAPIIEDMD